MKKFCTVLQFNGMQIIAYRSGIITLDTCRTIPILSILTVAPAFHTAIGEPGAGEVFRRRNFGDTAQHDGISRRRLIVTDIHRVFPSQFAEGMITPADGGVVVKEGAGMGVTGGDLGDGAGAQVDGRQVVSHFTAAIAEDIHMTLAELAGAVGAPAFHIAIVEQGAAELGTGGDLCGRAPRPEVDRRQVTTHGGGEITDIEGISLAKLAIGVGTPALDITVIEEGTGVVLTGPHLFGIATRAEIGRQN